MSKKIISGALTAATALWMSGALVVPVHAQTVDIAALMAQIAALQAQISSLQGGTTTSCPTFTRDLTVGSRGTDVQALQEILIAKGYLKISAATQYFGSMTKAAVSAWQKDAGVSPTAGYFGAKSRAALAASCVPSTPGGSTGTPGGSTGGVPTVPTTGQVSVSAGTNVSASVISGAAQVPVLNFRVSNGSGANLTVTGLRFTKTGVVSDSNISNAYISVGNNIVAQYTGLTGGVLTFTGNLFDVPAGSAVDATLRIDVASGTSNGNTVGFSIASAADVMLSSGTAMGTFPIMGATHVTTSVSNPSLASISTPTYQTVASSVDAGSTGFRASSITLTVQNSAVKLQSLRYTVSGSVTAASDLKNLVLKIDGTQVATATGLTSDGKAYFDLSASPATLNTGSHNIEVYVDVMGTPNRNFKFEILRPFDWVMTDTQYNTNISAGTPTGTATTVTVRQGTVTMSLDSSTPTGNLPLGGTNVTLAKFAVRAAGEAVRIKWMNFTLTKTGGANWGTNDTDVDTSVRNIALYGDDGSQLGTTINTPSSCSGNSGTNTTYSCSFGTSASNINYMVPANTTRVLSLRGDIQSGADITAIRGSLTAPGGNNVEGQISFQTSAAPGGEISGSLLTIVSSPFTASQNSSLSTQTLVGGAYNQKIASFSLSASSAEGINLSSVTMQTSATVNDGTVNDLEVQNLVAKVGSTSWNYIQSTVAASTSYTFSSPSGTTLIPAGGSVVVDVYADVLTNSSSTTHTAPVKLVGAVGNGANTNTNQTLKNTSGTAITTGVPVNGQNITIAGAGTVTFSVNSSDPVAQQIVQGATGVVLARFSALANNNEDIKIQTLVINATSTTVGAPATFNNLTLTVDGTTYTGTALVDASPDGYNTTFNFATPLVIPKNTTKELLLKGDVATFSESGTSHNKVYTFRILASGSVTAFGSASSQAASIGGSYPMAANSQTVLRTKVTAAMASTGSTSGRVRTAVDDVGTLSFTADNAYGAEIKTVVLTLSGAVLNATNTFNVLLVDESNQTASTTSITTIPGDTSKTATFNILSPSTTGRIQAGQTRTFKVRVDSSGFGNASNSSDSLSVQIAAAGNVTWQQEGGSESLNLQSNAAPSSGLTVTVSYE